MASRTICRNFSNTGSCSFGDTCKFSHSLEQASHRNPIEWLPIPDDYIPSSGNHDERFLKPWNRGITAALPFNAVVYNVKTLDGTFRGHVARHAKQSTGSVIMLWPFSDDDNLVYQKAQRQQQELVQQNKDSFDREKRVKQLEEKLEQVTLFTKEANQKADNATQIGLFAIARQQNFQDSMMEVLDEDKANRLKAEIEIGLEKKLAEIEHSYATTLASSTETIKTAASNRAMLMGFFFPKKRMIESAPDASPASDPASAPASASP